MTQEIRNIFMTRKEKSQTQLKWRAGRVTECPPDKTQLASIQTMTGYIHNHAKHTQAQDRKGLMPLKSDLAS